MYHVQVCNCMDNVITKCTQSASNVTLCGDFNINMLSRTNCIQDTLDIHGARNIVKDPTYFKNNNNSDLYSFSEKYSYKAYTIN